MKKGLFVLGLILAICGARASYGQIVTEFRQGFETTESANYQITGSTEYSTTIFSGGNRSLKMNHTGQNYLGSGLCAVWESDTIDLSTNPSYDYFYLEFMHICTALPGEVADPNEVAQVEAIRCDGLPGTIWEHPEYDMSWGGGSIDYAGNPSFSRTSYTGWQGTATNTMWKRERFALNSMLRGHSMSDRKVVIRIYLHSRTSGSSSGNGWYLDDITVKCSQATMSLPSLAMRAMPDLDAYPNSRAARIDADITTSAVVGMDTDSIYVLYKVGHNPAVNRVQMNAVPNVANRYRAYIPFCGFDTVVQWRLVAMDATVNHNMVNFPENELSWRSFHFVRGTEQFAYFTTLTESNCSDYPLPADGDSKAQFVYDMPELINHGFGPGAITQLRFKLGNSVSNNYRDRFILKMTNVPSSYQPAADDHFYTEYEKTVYDSTLVISQNANTLCVINLQDTFFYSGEAILMTIMNDQSTHNDPAAVQVKSVTTSRTSVGGTPVGNHTLQQHYSKSFNFNPITDNIFATGERAYLHPNWMIRQWKHLPLLYDCGISALVTPNDTTSANAAGNNNIIVTLNNYGAQPINAVRIYFKFDNAPTQYYDWSGSLAAGAQTNVTVSSTQTFTPGYHEYCAWVDDSVTSGGVRYRDHEPLNDTMCSRFVGCADPLSGTVSVGAGPSYTYQTLDNCLYVLSQCGVSGPLTVKLAADTYGPTVWPNIPGTSATNVITFEPQVSGVGSVTFTPNGTNSNQIAQIVNLQQANHIRFNRIVFNSNGYSAPSTYLVRLGMASTGCIFDSCTFSETHGSTTMTPAQMTATALLYSGGCDSLRVRNCTFLRGTAGISLIGPAADNKAHGNIIERSSFEHQGTNGVIVRNQVNAIVDSNQFNDVYANSSYIILIQDCDGATRITRNIVYVTSGASCIGATDFAGAATGYAVVANNFLVSEDQGTSNMLTTPLNMITLDYVKVVHNSIKLTAPSRGGIAAATFGGGTLNHSQFYNNIVMCNDTVNFAFNYIPNAGNTNYIGNNIYYTHSPTLNKSNGVLCPTFAAWNMQVPGDQNSQNVNPAFLNSTSIDLRSYSQNVKNHGAHIPEVMNDVFGTVRDSVSPCVGAFEFTTLPYDFEISDLLEPVSEYCNVPDHAPLRVVIKNSGMNTYNPGTQNLQLTYSRTSNVGVMVPGNSGNIFVNRSIPANDTIHFEPSNANLQFPTNGMRDTQYTFSFWLTTTIDPNPANDTSQYQVLSKYHAPAPDSIQMTINYSTQAVITPVAGVQTWASNIYNSGRQERSMIYWYSDPAGTNLLYRGSTLTTDVLYDDTLFYIRQHRDMGLMKITEVQTKRTGSGVTAPMPAWVNNSANLLIEMTNVGDYPYNLEGDTIMMISNENNLNNKIYVFPSITIQPHACITLQWQANVATNDSTRTIGLGSTVSPAYNKNFAILYRDGRGIVDGVAFNNITTQAQWASAQVPNTVWSGAGITLNNGTAGVYRTGWPTNPNGSPSSSTNFWQVADDTLHNMAIGVVNQSLIRYSDNGCLGDISSVRIHMASQPQVDLALDSMYVPEGCGVGIENMEVTVHNYGVQASSTVVAMLAVNGTVLCVDTLGIIPAHATVNHQFSSPVDFTLPRSATSGADFELKAWVEHQSNDVAVFNDTTAQTVHVYFTPNAPSVVDSVTVNYGTRATLTALPGTLLADSLVWLNNHMTPLDTVNTFTTDYIYANSTFYAAAMGYREQPVHIGTMAQTNAATAYPSPYNPNKKFVKEQYLYLASQIQEAGHSAGPIKSVAFYLDTIVASAGTMTFDYYTVSIGTTEAATFTGNGAWATVAPYFSDTLMTINNTMRGWIRHDFDEPFMWDGTSNLVVQICRALPAAITQGARTRYTSGGSNTVLMKSDNSSDLYTVTSNGTRSANRPDIQLGFLDYNCMGEASPVFVEVVGVPPTEAGLKWPIGTDTMSLSSCGATNLDVLVVNHGTSPLTSYTVDYWVDNVHASYTGTTTVAPQDSLLLTIGTPTLMPGRHSIRAAITADGDTVPTNDTIQRMVSVSFCAGTYTIGTTGDYTTFTEAIDTLTNAGVAGAVVFSVQTGSYNEQLTLGAVRGASAANTITFQSATGNAEDVVLRFAPVQAANWVLKLDGINYVSFDHMTVYAAGTGNYSNAVVMENVQNVNFNSDVVRVKGTINNNNAIAMTIGLNVRYLYLDSCVVDSGYYSVKSAVTLTDTTYGMYFTNNSFQNFWSMGINLRKVNQVYIVGNQVRSGVNISGRALTGIYIAEHSGMLDLEANNVSLYDERNGGKRGIQLSKIKSSNNMRSMVYNNMAACYGTGISGNTSCGIWIDSCEFMNVYYNTTNVYAGLNAATTRAFSVAGASEGIHVMNNVFCNQSKGYGYYVQAATSVVTSDYNNYYSSAQNAETAPRLAYWGTDGLRSLDTLRQTNSQDVHSMSVPAYFVSYADLHYSIGTFCEKAQYNTAVPKDIDGQTRPQIPSPTMGADEYTRCAHNIAITDILEPQIGVTENVESDSLRIVVRLYNDGTSVETNLEWWADMDGLNLTSPHIHIDEMQPQSELYDTTYIAMPIGIIDTQVVTVHFPLNSANDCELSNNTLSAQVFLDPAYNLSGTSVTVDYGDNCRLQNTPVSITVTNVGKKDIPVAYPLTITFQAILQTTGVTVSTLPLSWSETYTLTEPIEVNASATLNFSQTANLYPTGIAKDIQVRCRGAISYLYDQKPANDTTSYTTVSSKYTPSAPQGIDLQIPYATWDTIFASHTDTPPTGALIHRPIRWHRDSTADPYFSPTNYNQSTWWETPQYFHDSTYYLSCISATGCTSYFSQVHVNLNPRVARDAAVLEVVEPLPGMVYMSKDSVKIAIINYGTQPISNIPVVYQLYNHSNILLQEVHETCPATIQPDSVYVYRFDSLMNIPSWNANYKIRTWTDLSNEQVRLNDTLRERYQFTAYPESQYGTPAIANLVGLDIVRVAYSSLDNTINEIGNDYINFASFNNPAVTPLHMIKGTTDTMILGIANSDSYSDYSTKGLLTVYIDYNRDGSFDMGIDTLPTANSELIFKDTIMSRHEKKFVYTIPSDCALGYMRMRVILQQGSSLAVNPNTATFDFGMVQDYLLYIEDIPPDVDLSLSRISAPRNHILDSANSTVTFMMTNKGRTTATSATINYAYIDGRITDHSARGSFDWTGSLEPGQSVELTLPQRNFYEGTTGIKIVVSAPGDTIVENDTLWYEYHLFHTVTLILNEDFEGVDKWYAPRGYNAWSANWFERGTPHKQYIQTAVSDSNVWATNLGGNIYPLDRGNMSVLYSPKIDISQIRPDSIHVWIAASMTEGHHLVAQFYDYRGRWQNLGSANDSAWYNDGSGWTGSTPAYGYEKYSYATSHQSGDFQQVLQFRFIYHADPGSTNCDGVAIDNVYIDRAQRAIDIGVVELTYPTHPQFGQTINPRVVLKNFGYDTIYSAEVAYRPYGSHMAKTGQFVSETGLAPGDVTLFSFDNPFTVLNTFPDTFQICAFTRNQMDIYHENDSTCKDFYLSPLDNDMGMVSFLSPLDRIVAGDSIVVNTRIRNFGQAPVSSLELVYVYNNSYEVHETVNFQDVLGHDLQSFEYFNYTFRQKVRASMGVMFVEAYVVYPQDDYLFNDTIKKSVMGISAITDLSAREVIVDTSGYMNYEVQLVVDNVGARSANNFEVGFWYYNDTTTIVRDTFHGATPLAALSTLYFHFDTLFPQQPERFRYVTGYVHVVDDNDPSNDTTHTRGQQYTDLRAIKIIVEENREATCHVYLLVENIGNMTSTRQFNSISGSINGSPVRMTSYNRMIVPGNVYFIEFEQTIPKSPTRTYQGTISFVQGDDQNQANNQTSEIEVWNYVDDIPVSPLASGLSLGQNIPNPFDNSTLIEFHLPSGGDVKFFVMDEMGRLVYQILKNYPAGDNAIKFTPDQNVASGVYFYGIEFNGERMMRKMVFKN